jgi:hypothetical protein
MQSGTLTHEEIESLYTELTETQPFDKNVLLDVVSKLVAHAEEQKEISKKPSTNESNNGESTPDDTHLRSPVHKAEPSKTESKDVSKTKPKPLIPAANQSSQEVSTETRQAQMKELIQKLSQSEDRQQFLDYVKEGKYNAAEEIITKILDYNIQLFVYNLRKANILLQNDTTVTLVQQIALVLNHNSQNDLQSETDSSKIESDQSATESVANNSETPSEPEEDESLALREIELKAAEKQRIQTMLFNLVNKIQTKKATVLIQNLQDKNYDAAISTIETNYLDTEGVEFKTFEELLTQLKEVEILQPKDTAEQLCDMIFLAIKQAEIQAKTNENTNGQDSKSQSDEGAKKEKPKELYEQLGITKYSPQYYALIFIQEKPAINDLVQVATREIIAKQEFQDTLIVKIAETLQFKSYQKIPETRKKAKVAEILKQIKEKLERKSENPFDELKEQLSKIQKTLGKDDVKKLNQLVTEFSALLDKKVDTSKADTLQNLLKENENLQQSLAGLKKEAALFPDLVKTLETIDLHDAQSQIQLAIDEATQAQKSIADFQKGWKDDGEIKGQESKIFATIQLCDGSDAQLRKLIQQYQKQLSDLSNEDILRIRIEIEISTNPERGTEEVRNKILAELDKERVQIEALLKQNNHLNERENFIATTQKRIEDTTEQANMLRARIEKIELAKIHDAAVKTMQEVQQQIQSRSTLSVNPDFDDYQFNTAVVASKITTVEDPVSPKSPTVDKQTPKEGKSYGAQSNANGSENNGSPVVGNAQPEVKDTDPYVPIDLPFLNSCMPLVNAHDELREFKRSQYASFMSITGSELKLENLPCTDIPDTLGGINNIEEKLTKLTALQKKYKLTPAENEKKETQKIDAKDEMSAKNKIILRSSAEFIIQYFEHLQKIADQKLQTHEFQLGIQHREVRQIDLEEKNAVSEISALLVRKQGTISLPQKPPIGIKLDVLNDGSITLDWSYRNPTFPLGIKFEVLPDGKIKLMCNNRNPAFAKRLQLLDNAFKLIEEIAFILKSALSQSDITEFKKFQAMLKNVIHNAFVYDLKNEHMVARFNELNGGFLSLVTEIEAAKKTLLEARDPKKSQSEIANAASHAHRRSSLVANLPVAQPVAQPVRAGNNARGSMAETSATVSPAKKRFV